MTNLQSGQSSLYIAAALVVLRTKPSTTSVSDYIHCLRRSLQDSKRYDAPGNLATSCSDGTWKELFEASQYETLVLRSRVAELEEKIAKSDHIDGSVQLSHRKKKLDAKSTTVMQANVQSKRKSSIPTSNDDSQHEYTVNHQIASDCTLVVRILKTLAQLERKCTITSGHLPQLELACHIAIHVIRNSVKDGDTLPKGSYDSIDVSHACTATQQLWTAITQCLQHSETKIRHELLAKIAPVAAGILRSLLDCLDLLCRGEADRRSGVEQARKAKRIANTKSSVQNQALDTQIFQKGCLSLCSTILCMISEGHAATGHENPLSEALISIFLDHLGSSMSIIVLEDIIGEGFLLSSKTAQQSRPDHAAILATTDLQAPYLVQILRCVVQLMRLKTSKGAEENAFGSKEFAGVKWRQMQNTLLAGLFRDSESTFKERLEQPDQLEAKTRSELVNLLDQHASNTGLCEQVWDLLGWDILMDEDI